MTFQINQSSAHLAQPEKEQQEIAGLVYALGKIDYDIPGESRRNSLATNLKDPKDPKAFLAHLNENPHDAESVVWVLKQEDTPIYAIHPQGPFARETYERLRNFLAEHQREDVDMVSIPGYLMQDSISLGNRQDVPVIIPELRGMYSWNTPGLVRGLLGECPTQEEEAQAYVEKTLEIKNFLDRIYYEIRNLGQTSAERAINFAATNAYRLDDVYTATYKSGLKLDRIEVEPSPGGGPPLSDCWDVKLTFFHPTQRMEKSKELFRFMIDVSDVVPYAMGKMRHWHQH